MTAINLDSEIVSSRYDPRTKLNYYTIERAGKRWTVSIPTADLDTYNRNPPLAKKMRRDHVGRLLLMAMHGSADGERAQT